MLFAITKSKVHNGMCYKFHCFM